MISSAQGYQSMTQKMVRTGKPGGAHGETGHRVAPCDPAIPSRRPGDGHANGGHYHAEDTATPLINSKSVAPGGRPAYALAGEETTN